MTMPTPATLVNHSGWKPDFVTGPRKVRILSHSGSLINLKKSKLIFLIEECVFLPFWAPFGGFIVHDLQLIFNVENLYVLKTSLRKTKLFWGTAEQKRLPTPVDTHPFLKISRSRSSGQVEQRIVYGIRRGTALLCDFAILQFWMEEMIKRSICWCLQISSFYRYSQTRVLPKPKIAFCKRKPLLCDTPGFTKLPYASLSNSYVQSTALKRMQVR